MIKHELSGFLKRTDPKDPEYVRNLLPKIEI